MKTRKQIEETVKSNQLDEDLLKNVMRYVETTMEDATDPVAFLGDIIAETHRTIKRVEEALARSIGGEL